MAQSVLTSLAYRPSSPVTGSEQAIFRAQNLILEGQYPHVYFRAYKGSENLNETIPAVAITGTIDFDPTTKVITGSGTSFQDELHLGQMIQAAGGEVIVVGSLTSQISFIADRLPLTTGSGEAATRLPILGELNVSRFSMLRGNALHFDKGTILAVGDGVLYVNGAVLPGDSLTATRQAQVAVYDSATNTYDVQSLGFVDVPVVTNTDITILASGGTKNMSLGYYSFKVAYYSDITSGFGNPTDTLLEAGLDGYQLTVANSQFVFDFTADVGTRPAKATGYLIYASAFAGSSDISKVNAIQGGWFEVKRVAFTDLASNTLTFDYTDSELTSLVSFDNDVPPDAEFLSTIDLYPFLVSTDGQGVNSTGRETTTSPGPFVSPAKPENLDAYPAAYKVPTGKGETILGVVSAAGRFFVMTPNTLQAVTPTGLPAAPFTCRPFWHRGFVNPYNLIFIDDTLYGYSGKKLFRSIATGDAAEESYTFTTDVEAQLAESSGGYVFLGMDGKNQSICVFLSAIRQNDDGYWETDIHQWSLTKSVWMPKIVLSSTTRDQVVSGVATVNNELMYIAGGRMTIECDDDAVAFNTAAGITDLTQEEAICQLVADIKDAGLWTDAPAIYPFVGGTASSTKYNLKDPQDTNGAYRITWIGGVTHDDDGVTGNGTTGYGDTHCAPNVLTTFDTSLSVYCGTGASGFPANWTDIGYASGPDPNNLLFSASRYDGVDDRLLGKMYEGGTQISDANSDALGFWTCTRTANNSLKIYHNGVEVASNTTTSTGSIAGNTLSMYVLAVRLNFITDAPVDFSGRNLRFAMYHPGVDATQALALYNAVQGFQVALNRAV